MHYLHKILVYIPDVVSDRRDYEKTELLEAIRNHAENQTESYYEQALTGGKRAVPAVGALNTPPMCFWQRIIQRVLSANYPLLWKNSKMRFGVV